MDRKEKIQEISSYIIKFTPKFKKLILKKPINGLGINVTQQEFLCFVIISQEGVLSMTELADRLNVSLQQLTRVIDSLVYENLIIRFVPEDNRRKVCVKLSENGKEKLCELYKYVVNVQSNYLEQFSNDDLDKLFKHIKGIYEILFINAKNSL